MLDSDWLIAKILKTAWLDWIRFISARLNSESILIFFHVKNNWLRILLFLFIFIHFFRLCNFSFLNFWDILNLPYFFYLLIRNERIACLEFSTEYTRLHASRHRKHCGVLKCSNCNFYAYSSEDFDNHIKEKHCQHNVELCAQQSQNTLHEKVKLIYFL